MVSSETIVFEGIGAETNAGPLEDLKTFENKYRHSLIYAVNVGTHRKIPESKNRVNRGYLVLLKGRKIE